MSDPASAPRWPWAWFLAAAAWSVLIRVPLVMNAARHLDSDLAVDGLTLLDATRGQWRWHYPGTPFIGIGPVFLSYPQAMLWGANPSTLVSGGVVAWVALVLAAFVMAWRASGPRVASWSLVPLAFASTGAVWLSGRITGGHLVAAVWHAGAFAILAGCLGRGPSLKTVGLLGVWCGLGMALDSMFAVTLAGLVAAAVGGWALNGGSRGGLRVAAVFIAAMLAGVWPRYVGEWVEPYDAYREQFAAVKDPEILASHARILAADCLPRLVAGHRLPGFESDPDPASISAPGASRRGAGVDPVGVVVVGLTLPMAVGALACLVHAAAAGPSTTARVVASGLIVSAGATAAGFVVNRNIFNSDNYRYLVGMLVPWSFGFGLLMDWLVKKGRRGFLVASGLTVLWAVLMTADLLRWYARFGWVDGRGAPVSGPVDDPVLGWLAAHPDVGWIEGGYWDVYRLSFLTGDRVRGKPYPVYPDRFPEWRPGRDMNSATVVRSTPEGVFYGKESARRGGRRSVFRVRGATIYADLDSGR